MSTLWTRLVSGVLFPLHERLKRHDTVAVRRRLEESQWWPAERLAAARLEALAALFARAARESPWWAERLRAAGLDARAPASLDDLARLPLLDKPTIRAHAEAMKARGARGLARFTTGGSSGEPLVFFIGRERVTHDVAAKWRATRWWGVDIGDPEVVLWGSPIETGAQDRVREWRDWLFRTRLLPAFEMSPAKLDGFIEVLRRVRPRMLFGYPSALAHLARHAGERGARLDDLGLEVAFVTSERLYDHQREAITAAFGAPVANGYGGRDAGFIAHECPAGGMHLTAEDLIVEVVDGAGRVLPPGESGEVVVTHLRTGDFPFIRYRTGDVAVLDDRACACGRTLPLIRSIEGRTTDFVVAADGTVMHGLALIYVLRAEPAVANFRFVQDTPLESTLYVEPGTGWDEAVLGRIRAGLLARLGAGVHLDVQICARVPPEASGKHRYIVSRVAPRG